MAEESIYNLILKEYVSSPKPPIYRSKYPFDISPTYSTFGIHTTSKPNVSNVCGEYRTPQGKHNERSLSATFGKLKGTLKKNPQNFRLKQSGNFKLPEPQNSHAVQNLKSQKFLKINLFWD